MIPAFGVTELVLTAHRTMMDDLLMANTDKIPPSIHSDASEAHIPICKYVHM
jgi:hypothetical protein